MANGPLPEDGPLRIGPVTLPTGRRIVATFGSGQAVAWATNDPVPDAGLAWSALLDVHPETGLVPILLAGLDGQTSRPWDEGEFEEPADVADLDHLAAADILASAWDDSMPDDEEQADEETRAHFAATLGPFSLRFPGLAPPQQSSLNEDRLREALESLPPARVGLVAAGRSADVLPRIGWIGATNRYGSSMPVAAVLRSWEDRFGARLLQVGFADIRLLVERPPTTLATAQPIAAEHVVFCDECAAHTGQALTTIPEIAPMLVDAPIWSFWWD